MSLLFSVSPLYPLSPVLVHIYYRSSPSIRVVLLSPLHTSRAVLRMCCPLRPPHVSVASHGVCHLYSRPIIFSPTSSHTCGHLYPSTRVVPPSLSTCNYLQSFKWIVIKGRTCNVFLIHLYMSLLKSFDE